MIDENKKNFNLTKEDTQKEGRHDLTTSSGS